MLAGHSSAVLLAFEGPDRYSSVGGLGTRETSFARALGEAGVETTLIFIGDPAFDETEAFAPHVTLRRWGQWISAQHPRDVYDGEMEKVRDFTSSVPRYLLDTAIAPAAARGERVLIVAEEWQTVEAVVALDALLREEGLRDAATLFWNANNTYGFDRIDWPRLQRSAAVMTVSKFMKFELAQYDVPALVVPNGIDDALLDGPPKSLTKKFRKALHGEPSLVKVGRFDPDKNWLQAIDAVSELARMDFAPQLIVRGGREPYGDVVLQRARSRGLRVERVEANGDDGEAVAAALAKSTADVVHLQAFLPDTTLAALYNAADAVLANSGKEPFGLVGLEVMAARGIAVCGATGEEYADPFVNAIVCDTNDGHELAQYLTNVYGDKARVEKIREAGYETAKRYRWSTVLETFAQKIAYVARSSAPIG